MIYKYTFPINDYHDEAVFMKSLYFSGTRCPSHEEVVTRLSALVVDEQKRSEDANIIGTHTFEYRQCLEAIITIENGGKLPTVSGNIISRNVFSIHPTWGRKPLTISLIQPEEFEIPYKAWYE